MSCNRLVERARAAAVWCMMLATLCLVGCRPSRGANTGEAAAGLIEPREIPIVFYVLQGPGMPNTTTDEDIWGAIELANQVYGDGQISFYIHAVQRLNLQYLYRNEDGDELLPWSAVAADATLLAPGMASLGFDDNHRTHRAGWLGQVAARLPADAITIFVTPFAGTNGKMWGANCASPFPHNDGHPYYDLGPGRGWSRDVSRGIYCTPAGRFPGRHLDAIAHEFGHYLGGLNHTWDTHNAGANGPERAVPEDYFDLLYAPTPDGRGFVRFDSAEQAALTRGTTPLDTNCENCADKASRRVIPGTACVTEFRIPVAGGSVVLNSAEHAELLRGLAYAPRPGDWRYGINVMSYLHQDPEKTPCALRLSRSQILIVHRKLHNQTGQRNMLGTVSRARLSPPPNLVRR